MTTSLPGAKTVLIYGLTDKPCSTAFLATNPAMIIESGFDVFVQDVIAAITTDPCFNEYWLF